MENEEKEKQEGKIEVKNPALRLAKKLQENRKKINQDELWIGRVPIKTKRQFQELAKLEFCGDYGMTLKWLMDDILSADTRMIVAKLQDQEARLQALESIDSVTQEEEPEEESSRKMLDGKRKKVKK